MRCASDPLDDQAAGGGETLARGWRRLFEELFDPHPSNVALVGVDGVILAVNVAWRQYARANAIAEGYEFVGQNYLAICAAGVSEGDASAREAYVGLLEVMRNGRPKFTMTSPCHSPDQRAWYRMWVEPQAPAVPAVIVAHQLMWSKPWARGGQLGVTDDDDGGPPSGWAARELVGRRPACMKSGLETV